VLELGILIVVIFLRSFLGLDIEEPMRMESSSNGGDFDDFDIEENY